MIHPTAEILTQSIGTNTRIWHHAQIRERARIGENCSIGKGVYIDFDVVIGNNVKIQNYASVYHGALIEDGVFIGPYACLANDKVSRAINPDGTPKREMDWQVGKIIIKFGATVGAGAIIIPDVTVGAFGFIAAGSVVTKDVPEYGLVIGNPAKLVGYVCKCGRRLKRSIAEKTVWSCEFCAEKYDLERYSVDPRVQIHI